MEARTPAHDQGSAPASVPLEDADVVTSSDEYARRFAGPVGEWFLEVQARHTLELLSPWPRASVLEVGGGHGQLTGALVDSGRDVTVYSSDVACRARVAPWVDKGRVRFEWGNLLRAPHDAGAFDVVVCVRLLPHVTGRLSLVTELCRLARHAVVLDYPSARSVNAAARPFFGLKKEVEGDTRPFAVFRDGEVAKIFALSGFHRTGRRPQFLFAMALHRALGAAGLSRGLEALAAGVGLTGLAGSPVIARFERRG
jgi:SAM-dependent methyltransferase